MNSAVVSLVLVSLICCNNAKQNPTRDSQSQPEKRDVLIDPHYVTTKDGYILEMHRVHWTRNTKGGSKSKRPVAFLMHGLFGSAKGFTHLGIDSAIAYNLAENGIDVWMGNARGTTPSRHHIILNPKNQLDLSKYFNYGFDEISKYDLSAMIDYILKYTNSGEMHYVAHSQGGYYLFMLLSIQPEYANKFKTVHLLGCAGSLKNMNVLITQLVKYLKNLYQWGLDKQILELNPSDLNNTKNRPICSKDTFRCEKELAYLIELLTPPELRTESVSMKQLSHYGQMLEIQEFKSWDQGSSGNLMLYGSLDPINYNFSAITAPTTMYFSTSDILTNNDDVKASKKMRSSIKVVKITDPLFTHRGYLDNSNVKRYVTKNIIKSIFNVVDKHPGVRFFKNNA